VKTFIISYFAGWSIHLKIVSINNTASLLIISYQRFTIIIISSIQASKHKSRQAKGIKLTEFIYDLLAAQGFLLCLGLSYDTSHFKLTYYRTNKALRQQRCHHEGFEKLSEVINNVCYSVKH
jgi:hypothetical protein